MSEDEVVMYIIVNSDLKMSKGKIAAQVGHIVMRMTDYAYKILKDLKYFVESHELDSKLMEILSKYYTLWKYWRERSYPKVVLKADWVTMQNLRLKLSHDLCEFPIQPVFEQFDEGRTQVPQDSLTVVGFFPMRRKDAPEEIKKLKLL